MKKILSVILIIIIGLATFGGYSFLAEKPVATWIFNDIEVTKLKLSVTNSFLINTGNQYVLIDTGYEHDWNLFSQRLKTVGVTLSEISHIILTHHHDDHCGLLNKIIAENNEVRVVLSYLAKNLIAKGENDRTHNGGFINNRIKQLKILKNKFDKHWNELKFTPYQVRDKDILITGETKLSDIGINLNGKIIETPGHSKDSISVILNNGNCFVGDAAANIPILQLVGANYCVLVLEDLNEYYKSWQKIIAQNTKTIYPGHGKPFSVEKLVNNLGKNKKEDIVSNK